MLIIHGDNQLASRNAFLEKKQVAAAGLQIVDLDGRDLNLPQLKSALSSQNLFGQSPAIFIEQFFSRPQSAEKKKVAEFLATNPENITFWDPKDVTSQLSIFNSQSSIRFDLPKYLFKFLDDLTVVSFQKAVKVAPVEVVFASLVTRLLKKKQGVSGLLDIDYKHKTGSLPMDLTAGLELWLIKRQTGSQ